MSSAPNEAAASSVTKVAGASDHRAALFAGFLGWTLDAFDFFLVSLCLTAIAKEFNKSDAEIALSTTTTLAFRSGAAPSYTSFMILRALFGIGMGGEGGVGASRAMEKVPPRLRGVFSGLLQEGYAAGFLLASICSFFVLERWGWRPMFFIGGFPALLALFVRFRVKESEVWEKNRHKTWSDLGRAIASHWK